MKRKLPDNVSAFFDRHGKERFRYRMKGRKTAYLRGPFNSPEFKEDLKAARNAEPRRIERGNEGTINDLVARYYGSGKFQKAGSARQKVARGIIESFREEFGNDLVANFTFEHIEAILLAKSHKRREGKRMVGGPVAAQNLHKQLRRLFKHAVKAKLIASNPALEADTITAPKTGGRHPWSEEEIGAYRKRHALGTKARLAMEIFLWTGLRLGDGSLFGRKHIVDGQIVYKQAKTSKVLLLPAAPQLMAAIRATPMTGIETFLVTDYGKPFSANGLGNKMRVWCDEAGLPQCSAHGLRKALARRSADTGATQQQFKGGRNLVERRRGSDLR
jgi:integrase